MCRFVVVSAALLCSLVPVSPLAASVVYKGVPDLTGEASQIIIGDVVEVTSYWDAGQGLIKSHVVISVTDYLVGAGTGTETLEISGGTVGDTTLVVSVLPVFQAGDHVLLFLGDSEVRLVESFQGAYLTDGDQIARMAPGCGNIIDESRQPLADFLAEVQASLPGGTTLPPVGPYEGPFVLPVGTPRYSLCGVDWTNQASPMGESYKINASCVDSPAGDSASQIAQIQNGMNAWNSAGAHFAFTYGGTSTLSSMAFDGTNLIFFSMNPPDSGGYIAANYYWSNAGHMTETDIVCNDRDYTWWNGTGTCSGMMDIWNILTHELGHSLCLLDLYAGGDYGKTMYGYSDVCETYKRTLDPDDINGIVSIYGSGVLNDLCENATPVYNGNTYTGSTATAMNDGSATCGTSTTAKDVWYQYSALASGNLIVSTCTGSSYDTVLSIHSGCPGTSANQLACDDNSCATNKSTITLAVTGGNTYYIRVAGHGTASGTYALSVNGPSDTEPPTPNPMLFSAPPAPAPAAPSSAIDMTAATATDPSGGIQYAFEANTGAQYPGAAPRDWDASPSYTNTGLSPNTSYTYRAKARDGLGNVTTSSADASAVTYIEQPSAVTYGVTTADSIELLATGGLTNLTLGLSGVFFDGVTTGGQGGINTWVQAATDTATGLSMNTAYDFRAKARNQNGIETGFTDLSTQVTAMATPTGLTFGTTTLTSVVLNASGAFLNINTGLSGLYFNSTTPGVGGLNAWLQSTTDTATGLSANTSYPFQAKARNQTGVETPYCAVVPKSTLIETPTGVTYGTVTSNSIVLNAAGTFSNLTLGSSGLYFDSTTTGGDGGINEWLPAASDTATGLTPDTSYTFRVRARNQDGVPTIYSGSSSKRTLAAVPPAPTLANPTLSTMTLDVNAGGNPATTVFAVECTATSPLDTNWQGKYVSSTGTSAATAAWQTEPAWGVLTVAGLTSNTTYTFAVKARNGDGLETPFGPGAGLSTGGTTGACCDPTTGACTIATLSACTAGGRNYQGDNTTCTPDPCQASCSLLGDLNGDGVVNGLDIAGFVRAKLGQAPLPGENEACADYGTGSLNNDIAEFVADLLG